MRGNEGKGQSQEITFSEGEVVGVIQDMAIALLVISAVYAVMSFSSNIVILWEAAVTGVLTLLLVRTRSRGAAILLVIMSTIAILNGFVSVIGAVDLGTRNLPLAFISLWCSWRGLQATVELRFLQYK